MNDYIYTPCCSYIGQFWFFLFIYLLLIAPSDLLDIFVEHKRQLIV